MLKDKEGNRLFRKVTVRIVYPDNLFPPKVYTQHAGPRLGFGPNGIDEILMKTADQLDTLYPWWEFRYVELAPIGRTARFVFTYAGPRAISNSKSTTTAASPLEPGTSKEQTPTEVGNSLAVSVSQE